MIHSVWEAVKGRGKKGRAGTGMSTKIRKKEQMKKGCNERQEEK